MTGLMRVDVAAVEGLLCSSARDGWFVEPLTWLEEYPEACRKPPPIRWVVKERDEQPQEYLARERGYGARTHVGREADWSALETTGRSRNLQAHLAGTKRVARTAAHGGPREGRHAGNRDVE